MVQQHSSDDAVAQQDQDRSPDRLCSDDAQAELLSSKSQTKDSGATLRATLIGPEHASQRGEPRAPAPCQASGAGGRGCQSVERFQLESFGYCDAAPAIGRWSAAGDAGDFAAGAPAGAPSCASNHAWTRAIVSLRCSPGSGRVGGPKRSQIGWPRLRPARKCLVQLGPGSLASQVPLTY